MARYFVILISLAFTNTAIANNSEWEFTKTVDAITDRVSCSVTPSTAQMNKAIKSSYSYFPLISVDLEKIYLSGITKGTNTFLSLADSDHILRIDKNDIYEVFSIIFQRRKEYSLLIKEMIAGNFINVRTTDKIFGTETHAYSLIGFTKEYTSMKNDKDCAF